MVNKTYLRIHFYAKQHASVHFESTHSDEDMKSVEILVFVLHMLRMMVNLGVNSYATKSLIEDLVPMIPEAEQDLAGLLERNAREVTLTDYNGGVGSKLFVLNLVLTEDGIDQLRMEQHGFGMLAFGAGYYSTQSVKCLLRHFAAQRTEDRDYYFRLFASAGACIFLAKSGQLSMANQTQLACAVLAEVMNGDPFA